MKIIFLDSTHRDTSIGATSMIIFGYLCELEVFLLSCLLIIIFYLVDFVLFKGLVNAQILGDGSFCKINTNGWNGGCMSKKHFNKGVDVCGISFKGTQSKHGLVGLSWYNAVKRMVVVFATKSIMTCI